MSEPTTKAGRALLAVIRPFYVNLDPAYILAIEQEAARAERERIAAAVRESLTHEAHTDSWDEATPTASPTAGGLDDE